MSKILRRLRENWHLSDAARAERARDRNGLGETDPGSEAIIEEGVRWLARAQDESPSRDGGVARDYSLLRGWATSYPETTGYIVPTFLEYARSKRDDAVRERARRMLDWLVSIQLPGGGFQGGRIDSLPVVPVTFNTGQILIGLAAGQASLGTYEAPLIRAADWLVATQDEDGCWRKHPTPFAAHGEKAYETHVSWGLFEAARVVPGRGYGEAGLRQVRWALTKQRANGWIDSCCLTQPEAPLTHTLGYALRGILEAHRYSGDDSLLEAGRKTGQGLLECLGPEGYLPGRLRSDWRPAVDWVCLTGSSQIAHCWLMLYESTGEEDFLHAAREANSFVRRTIRLEGPPETRGAVKGSFPVDGGYGRYEFLNWAIKFTIDANESELRIAAGRGGSEGSRLRDSEVREC